MTDLAKLKALAEAARRYTKEGNGWQDDGDGTVFVSGLGYYEICSGASAEDAAYIAAASPDVVLALIAEVEALRAKVDTSDNFEWNEAIKIAAAMAEDLGPRIRQRLRFGASEKR